MRVRVGDLAWLNKSELTTSALQGMKAALTIYPRKIEEYDDGDGAPLLLYREEEDQIGVAREYFLRKAKQQHEIELDLTDGDKSDWPGDLRFAYSLRSEQQSALAAVLGALRSGQLGGILKAPCGFGKTIVACALIAALRVPTLIVVHKEFLVNQWRERILGDEAKGVPPCLPGAQVGIAQQDICDFRGKHIVIGMVHSLAKGKYSAEFRSKFGLVLVDELHRLGARSWCPVPTFFKARHRVGLTATPKRQDGADNVFYYHVGPILHVVKEHKLKPTIKRVYSKFRLVQTPNFNPNLAPESLVLRFLCANESRNSKIVCLMADAVQAGRKLLVLSKRLNHLHQLETMFRREWEARGCAATSIGYYVGGRTEEQLDEAAQAQILLATTQYAAEALDIPQLDTLFLTVPMGNVTQATGRILREYEGKKPPIVVDIRDDSVRLYRKFGEMRDRYYASIGAA
jgi:superfamily II DNA or RNA helicase